MRNGTHMSGSDHTNNNTILSSMSFSTLLSYFILLLHFFKFFLPTSSNLSCSLLFTNEKNRIFFFNYISKNSCLCVI